MKVIDYRGQGQIAEGAIVNIVTIGDALLIDLHRGYQVKISLAELEVLNAEVAKTELKP